MSNQKITWIGHGSWKYITNNGTVIYVDPDCGTPPAQSSSRIRWTHRSYASPMDTTTISERGRDMQKVRSRSVTLPEVYAYAKDHGVPFDDPRRGASRRRFHPAA
jgi:hypothetical protein